jgi:hypothetical protein
MNQVIDRMGNKTIIVLHILLVQRLYVEKKLILCIFILDLLIHRIIYHHE